MHASPVRVLLFHNPDAGDRELSRTELSSRLADAGHQATYRSIDDADWQDALGTADAELIAVAGGDGAVRKVLLAAGEAGDRRPFAILPIGTANNVARTLGLIGPMSEVLDAWAPPNGRPFDIGWVEAGKERRSFVEAVGGGLFAELISHGKKVIEGPDLLGHALDRSLVVLRGLLTDARPTRLGLSLDGTDLSGDYLGIEALNTRFAGPNVALSPGADPADGQLDLVLIRPDDRDGLLAYVDDRLAFGEAVLPELVMRRGREGRLSPPERWPLHVDDRPWEPREMAPIRVGITAAAITILGRS
jgi:diacylglycerol kinase family enzyme